MTITTIPAPIQPVEVSGTAKTTDLDREGVQEKILTQMKKMNLHMLTLTDTHISDGDADNV